MDVPSKGRGEGEITYPKVKDNFSHVGRFRLGC